ncbi:MAG TPA: sulfite exporter TauE/SafE family protein [Stellaceae bacterium]|nr:sulfite exporter TauE/SafE family protein [Stellaceae bacterium]
MQVINLFYSLSGFGVGMLVGMTGVGGGSLMTPILILLFGIHPVTAVGTDLLYAAATKTGGTLMHGLGGTIEWRIVALLAAGSVPMTALTLFVLSRFELSGNAASGVITLVLSAALFATAAALILRRQLVAFYARHVGRLEPRRTAALTVAMGGMLGVVVPITSVGAGAIGVTALILLYPELPTARIVGSDIAHAVPLTLVAGLGHWLLGSIDWTLLGSLLLGSLPGIMLGSHIAARVPDVVLRLTLAATLIVVGGRLAL